jgi:sulfur carrier protein ThiS adenylyltransferase
MDVAQADLEFSGPMLKGRLRRRAQHHRAAIAGDQIAACQALVIGVGAVGRQVALQSAATGVPQLTLVDHDLVEVVNLGPQAYAAADIGQPKVAATGEWCLKLNPNLILHLHQERFRRSSIRTLACFAPSGRQLAVFCCVDSIATRAMLWEAVRHHAGIYLDARMNAEVVRILAADQPATDSRYDSTLFAPEQAVAGSCTGRSTVYTASVAAGLMMAQFTRWLRRVPLDPDLVLNLFASELTVG